MDSSCKPRTINLNKGDGQSYGFFLRIEEGVQGHLIRNVEPGTIADKAGLKDGDRVVKVNGTCVDSKDHSKVVELIQESGTSVTLQVLDEIAYLKIKDQDNESQMPQPKPAQIMNGMAGTTPKPKLCYMVKDKSGYGFSLKTIKNVSGIFMTDVKASGVADKAGVKNNDRLIEINSENVEKCTHEQAVAKIKQAGNSVVFLLVDEDTDKYYKNAGMKITSEMANLKLLPHKPRTVELAKGEDGYGYYLKEEKARPGHFINEIDKGGPADRAGLENMDRIVCVNGDPVDSMSHEQVVERIRECGNKTFLMVIDEITDKIYKMAGVSPMLCWEEENHSNNKPLCTTPTTAPEDKVKHKPKLCKLEKTTSGFGFHLNAIRGTPGHFLKEVVMGSPAEQSGLVDDDILVEVNGVNVEKKSHEEVVEMIRSAGSKIEMLVAEKTVYNYFTEKNIPITTALIELPKTETCSSSAAWKEVHTEIITEKKAEKAASVPTVTEKKEAEPGPDPAPTNSSPAETRERAGSSSSSSSSEAEDERL
ncbi:Na(+)/H(+) exchange regulatory cofactor NHE-RF3 [Erpetoichthys calabaricus]|uniref:Na(+)/H(+) exchange regulatory cofactor NHE-RF3 n=1 Tax=Erpetoichthys calabaricus TaxID=27687 RepID=UPI0010A0179E|nr:Na(+)/H(+) exchange regulatory cofactor NHE-RF3 [Erpetoichthys calabaricus]